MTSIFISSKFKHVSIISFLASITSTNALMHTGNSVGSASRAWGVSTELNKRSIKNNFKLFSVSSSSSSSSTIQKQELLEEELVVRRYFEGVNETDFIKIRNCFAANTDTELRIRDVCGVNSDYRKVNVNDLVNRCREFLLAHPDCVVNFHYGPKLIDNKSNVNGDEKWVIAHWYETGTWSGKSCNIEPTFQPMAVEGQTRFKINNENLIEELVVTRTFTDWEIMQQQKDDNNNNKSDIMDETAWKNDLSLDELQSMLKVAEKAARQAGGIIMSNEGCCSTDDDACEVKFSIKDVVTEYDSAAQIAIEGIVSTAYPHHSFLGEENVDPGSVASEQALTDALSSTPSGFLWICDPIDGTANFASGLSMSAVTMGVVYKGIPIIGVVYDPHTDEMFTAIREQGAFCNGVKLQVAQAINNMKDAIINAGCPADPNAFEASMRGVLALNSKSRGIRIIACSALTTAWIASGRLTAHFGYDLSSWDLIAGALLIQEAGGCVTDLDGSAYDLSTRNMLCSNEKVHYPILDVLTKADAVSFKRSGIPVRS